MQCSERTEALLFKPVNNWGESVHDKGLILAYSDPFVQVYLIENKEESLAKAQSRIAAMGTNNIVLYQVRSSRSDFCKYEWKCLFVSPSFFLFIGSSKW